MYAGLFAVGILGLLTAQVVGATLLMSLLLVCIHLHDGNNGIDVIAPLAIVFMGGAFIQLQEKVLNRLFYPAAFLSLLLLFAPWTSTALLTYGRGFEFVFSWGIKPEEIRYLFYLASLPFAIIYVCRYFPVSTAWESDYSYGTYVYAWPIQQMSVAVFMQMVAP